MIKPVLLLAVVAVSYALPWVEIAKPQDNTLRFKPSVVPLEQQWANFKSVHSKNYNDQEDAKRKEIFSQNLKKIEIHNYLHAKGKKSYTLGVNEYADMEHSEFVKIMNGLKPRNPDMKTDSATYLSPSIPVSLPDQVDWRTKGYVTPVKNQGQCGSCWSFSTTGALEGQNFKKTGTLTSLSEQNLVDCSVAWGNNGCEGGLMDYAFQYIKDNRGIDTEESYPYQAVEGKCHYKKADKGASDVGFVDCTSGDESALKEASATVGPISIAIDASHQSFQLYSGGVYDEPECSSSQLDHGVLLVGYGTDGMSDYWLVKNSWGATWGDEGYVKMTRNKDNQCGVATQASYPQV